MLTGLHLHMAHGVREEIQSLPCRAVLCHDVSYHAMLCCVVLWCRFVSRLLQYRSSKATCTWRVFSKSNFSLFTTTDSE